MSDHVLIIDDSPVERKLIRWLLESRLDDVVIQEMGDGDNVMEFLQKNEVEACILDIHLPGKDGYQVLSDIRQHQKTRDIPVIICTGIDDIEGIRKALLLGALDYFAKPLSEEDMKISLPLKVRNAIELMKSKRQIDFLSYHDKLTGLYNRRFFEEEISRLGQSRQLPIAIIVGDVNGLKITNDVFGHEAGDRLLIRTAEILNGTCRREDLIARWGGDEFIIFLPGANAENAAAVCERITRACIAAGQKDSAAHLSIALGYAVRTDMDESLHQTIRKADEAMYKHKLLESRSYRSQMIASLQKTLFEKSLETSGHVERMAELSRRLGKTMGLSANDIDSLRLLALLHDIGKVVIPESILTKKDKLTDQEWEEIKRHPEAGYRIVQGMPELAAIAEGILCHHERWDGKGYPQGLKAEETPLVARIIAIIDSFDAMTHSRPYRRRLTLEQAIKELEKNAGSQFDPHIVKTFIEIIRSKDFQGIPEDKQENNSKTETKNE